MCGIFGFITNGRVQLDARSMKREITNLFLLSESRGKEASGLSLLHDGRIDVIKRPVPASDLVRTKEYDRVLGSLPKQRPFALVGHSRLVTNGAEINNYNNQPVVCSGISGVHNGIIVNDAAIWRKHPELRQQFEIDTESLFTLHRHHMNGGKDLVGAMRSSFAEIEGMATVAMMFEDLDTVLLATNNGSLYWAKSKGGDLVVFASELLILRKYITESALNQKHFDDQLHHLEAGTGLAIDLTQFGVESFSLRGEKPLAKQPTKKSRSISVASDVAAPATPVRVPGADLEVKEDWQRKVAQWTYSIDALKRCTKCILPETMPYIEFDASGVCNFCRHHKPLKLKGAEALERDIAKHRKGDGNPECIATFSGGRDSCYGLDYMVKKLAMTPLAYTYDWGMITDLGRRNQARMCGKLGVEHILVSADIRKKRAFIRKNVKAWLKRPDLGTVPLFMAGDKQYFYYAIKLMRETGVNLIVLCSNHFEKTDFKSGFCGIRPDFSEKSVYKLSASKKLRMVAYYAKEFLKNPAYLNSSLLDTVGAFASYYVMKHDFLNLFDYIPWEEDAVNRTVLEGYNWETAPDTRSTWRIGDGTASFYNYIYYTAAGFTENDTFRSNQIRAGQLTREKALQLVRDENKPRWESIKWYCDTIDIDFREAIERINAMPKRYRVQSLPAERPARAVAN